MQKKGKMRFMSGLSKKKENFCLRMKKEEEIKAKKKKKKKKLT